jgi:hypothetical protein
LKVRREGKRNKISEERKRDKAERLRAGGRRRRRRRKEGKGTCWKRGIQEWKLRQKESGSVLQAFFYDYFFQDCQNFSSANGSLQSILLAITTSISSESCQKKRKKKMIFLIRKRVQMTEIFQGVVPFFP